MSIFNTIGKTQDCFRTPDFFFNQLNDIFKFDVDAACSSENKKCKKGFCHDLGVNGLKESWGGYSVFCNPPFSQKADWIKKAHDEVLAGSCKTCVMILPSNSMDSQAFHDFVFGKFHFEILRGRIQFLNPDGTKSQGNNSGTVVIYFWKKPQVKAA